MFTIYSFMRLSWGRNIHGLNKCIHIVIKKCLADVVNQFLFRTVKQIKRCSADIRFIRNRSNGNLVVIHFSRQLNHGILYIWEGPMYFSVSVP